MSKKKMVIGLVSLAAYMAFVVLSRLGLPDFTILPVILCSLLCGFPFGPLMAVIASLLGHAAFWGYTITQTLSTTGIMLLISLIPSVLSYKAGTNLSAASAPSSAMAFIATAIAAVVNHFAILLYIWLMFVRPYGGTISLLPSADALCTFIAAMAVVPVLALKLSGNKDASGRSRRRHSDDDR